MALTSVTQAGGAADAAPAPEPSATPSRAPRFHVSVWLLLALALLLCCLCSSLCVAQHSQFVRARTAPRTPSLTLRALSRSVLSQLLTPCLCFSQFLVLCVLKGLLATLCCLRQVNWDDIWAAARAQTGAAPMPQAANEHTPLNQQDATLKAL